MPDVRAQPISVEETAGYTMLVDYSGGTNPVYIGLALPGSATSSSVWQIRKIEYDANGNVTAVKWASGTDAFDKIWNNRASYSYS